jgi:hypothetical protein
MMVKQLWSLHFQRELKIAAQANNNAVTLIAFSYTFRLVRRIRYVSAPLGVDAKTLQKFPL